MILDYSRYDSNSYWPGLGLLMGGLSAEATVNFMSCQTGITLADRDYGVSIAARAYGASIVDVDYGVTIEC